MRSYYKYCAAVLQILCGCISNLRLVGNFADGDYASVLEKLGILPIQLTTLLPLPITNHLQLQLINNNCITNSLITLHPKIPRLFPGPNRFWGITESTLKIESFKRCQK